MASPDNILGEWGLLPHSPKTLSFPRPNKPLKKSPKKSNNNKSRNPESVPFFIGRFQCHVYPHYSQHELDNTHCNREKNITHDDLRLFKNFQVLKTVSILYFVCVKCIIIFFT